MKSFTHIYFGDCKEELKKIGNDSIDLIFTSPPYADNRRSTYGGIQPDKGDYLKLCWQEFWYFISGYESLYQDIIEPLGRTAKEKNEEFNETYAQILNRFTFEFGEKYCQDGIINWLKLVKFNSGTDRK